MRILIIVFCTLLISCATSQYEIVNCKEEMTTPDDLQFRESSECAEYSETLVKAEIIMDRLNIAVAAPINCGLNSKRPSYSRRGETITVSVESDYDGGPVATCLCWRVMNFNMPVTSIGGDIPKVAYFVQDSTVYGEAIISE